MTIPALPKERQPLIARLWHTQGQPVCTGLFIHSVPGTTSLHAGNNGRTRTEAGTECHGT